MAYPRFSISNTSTFDATFEEDLAAYVAAGIQGIGIWEFKLPKGQDAKAREALQKSGLKATICVPQVPSIIPDPYFANPTDPKERRKELIAAIKRLGAFDPVAVMLLPGAPREGEDPKETRRIVREGLKAVYDAAGEAGVTLAFEPLRKSAGSIINTMPEALEFADEAGIPNMRIIYDTWHFWDTPGVYNHIRDHVKSIITVQVNDWPKQPRSWQDRLLTGDGIMDLSKIFGALETAGYTGWYDLEIFSDKSYPDSLLLMPPAEFAKRAYAKFKASWDKRETAGKK
jgi:sugar phosphate isomerase/epimerase